MVQFTFTPDAELVTTHNDAIMRVQTLVDGLPQPVSDETLARVLSVNGDVGRDLALIAGIRTRIQDQALDTVPSLVAGAEIDVGDANNLGGFSPYDSTLRDNRWAVFGLNEVVIQKG